MSIETNNYKLELEKEIKFTCGMCGSKVGVPLKDFITADQNSTGIIFDTSPSDYFGGFYCPACDNYRTTDLTYRQMNIFRTYKRRKEAALRNRKRRHERRLKKWKRVVKRWKKS